MKGAPLKGSALAIAVWLAAGTAFAAGPDVTDGDRLWVNFSREAAVLGEKHFWLELRGMSLMDDQGITQPTSQAGTTYKGPTLGFNGYPLNDPKCGSTDQCIEKIDGGRFDLLGAYGISATTEVGLDMPFVMQEQLSFVDGGHTENVGVGDLLLYGKLKHQFAEHVAGALGLEISIPTGSPDHFFGSGDLGLNPFLSTRYQSGRLALGAHAGFLLNSTDQPDVFNWSVDAIVRGNAMFALRCEVNGRQFRDIGNNYTDIAVWPGIDINLTDNVIIRPQGEAHATSDAIDWGLGLGLVFTM